MIEKLFTSKVSYTDLAQRFPGFEQVKSQLDSMQVDYAVFAAAEDAYDLEDADRLELLLSGV